MLFSSKPKAVPAPGTALPGRNTAIPTAERHFVFDHELKAAAPEGHETLYVAMGCFWGVERLFWQLEGVWLTAAGYAGGETPNPTYEETCTGRTGHTEVVKIIYDPAQISLDALLKVFWEEHDPTQGMRQGNDVGTQYRSALYTTTPQQLEVAKASATSYQTALSAQGLGEITTEIRPLDAFYYAEDYHQQYLAKNPNGYCGLAGTGVSCPIGLGVSQG
ncbi:MAG: peptide-methionine (S)-S-oxide reductase MsrA [Hyphomonadaceae bacterium]|nr:peptide-methionine (S)-S-oxide reductase MsrA [Hyphomonadaceae bacterium]